MVREVIWEVLREAAAGGDEREIFRKHVAGFWQ